MAMLGVASALLLSAFQDNIIFFYSPSEVIEKAITPGNKFRLGGLVEEKSLEKQSDGLTVSFNIMDTMSTVKVSYTGLLPDLFREGQGIVAHGTLDDSGVFVASEILAKHDETYMPPEVAEALKEAGQWQGQ